MGDLWKRKIRVEIPGLTVGGEPIVYEYPPWGIAFQITFDTTPQQNMAKIVLWNISRKTIQALSRGAEVRLYAGYEGDEVGLCFAGWIDRIETKYDGVDKLVTLICSEGSRSVLRARPNLSWPPGIGLARVAEELFMAAGVEIGAVRVAGDVKYQKGKICGPQTTVAGHLDQLCADAESMTGQEYFWYISLGKGYFVPRLWAPPEQVITVSPKTGLIGTPEPLNVVTANLNGVENEPKQWRVTTVFNWRIRNGAKIVVNSRRVVGSFKIQRGQHIGGPKDKMVTDLVCDPIDVTLIEEDYTAGDVRAAMPSVVRGGGGGGSEVIPE